LLLPDGGGRLRSLDPPDIARRAARRDDLGLGIAVDVLDLADDGVQPWHAAGLRPALGKAQVNDVLGRHTLVFVVLLLVKRALLALMALSNPISDRPIELVDLYPEPHHVPGRRRSGLNLVGDALGFHELERERHVRVAEGRIVQPHECLAGLEYLSDQGALEIVEVQAAAGVAGICAAPVLECFLDRVVHRRVRVAAGRLHLALQADPGADHVVHHDRLRAFGEGSVPHESARIGAQVPQTRQRFLVGARIERRAAEQA
jgi:hypothetical protein